jgi:hypothetical protein
LLLNYNILNVFFQYLSHGRKKKEEKKEEKTPDKKFLVFPGALERHLLVAKF